MRPIKVSQYDVDELERLRGIEEQVEQAQITAGAEAQIANEEHARAEGLLEQLEAVQEDHEATTERLRERRDENEALKEQLEAHETALREIAGLSAFETPGKPGSLITGPAIARTALGLAVSYSARGPILNPKSATLRAHDPQWESSPASDPFDAGGQVTHVHDPANHPTLDDRNPASVVGVPWNEEGYAGGESSPASGSKQHKYDDPKDPIGTTRA